MSIPQQRNTGAGPEAGFALILAMLTLMVLTLLGMALAATTSTELQIATNYRWSQQAYYNAEAGAEVGKRLLQMNELRTLVGDRRAATGCATASPDPCEMDDPPGDWTLARTGPSGEASRNWENQPCDDRGGTGYGNVMDIPAQAFPFQNTSNFLGEQLNGTFTIWVRRALEPRQIGAEWFWEDSEDTVILTVEGTAPYLGAQQLENRAVRYMEISLQRIDPSGCENYSGQIGAGPTGSNYDQCGQITAEGLEGVAGGSVDEIGAATE
jgi:hypothetical protein